MTTIEQRARQYANKMNGGEYEGALWQACYEIYIEIATDQKAIDDEAWRNDMRYLNIRNQELIDKACEWLKNTFEGGGYVQDWQITEFRKAMEE